MVCNPSENYPLLSFEELPAVLVSTFPPLLSLLSPIPFFASLAYYTSLFSFSVCLFVHPRGVEYGMTSNMLNYLNLKEDEVKFPFIFFLNIFGQRVYHFDKPIRNKANLEDFLESVYAEEAPYERIF